MSYPEELPEFVVLPESPFGPAITIQGRRVSDNLIEQTYLYGERPITRDDIREIMVGRSVAAGEANRIEAEKQTAASEATTKALQTIAQYLEVIVARAQRS